MPQALPIFVFDKDGVLVESEPIKLRLFEELLAQEYAEHLPAIRAFNRANVGLARRDKLMHVLGEIVGIKEGLEGEVDRLLDDSYHFIKEGLLKAPPVAGVVPFIQESENEKYVCSSALYPEVLDQLGAIHLEDAFAEVYAFPNRKANVLTKLKEEHPGQPIIFWGDTILDFRAAVAADVHFIGVRKPDSNPFDDLGVHTIPDFQDHRAIHEWVATQAGL